MSETILASEIELGKQDRLEKLVVVRSNFESRFYFIPTQNALEKARRTDKGKTLIVRQNENSLTIYPIEIAAECNVISLHSA